MSGLQYPRANATSLQTPDYEWRYEYYDDEPVSFEGLKAHRYSIVIGFWVGLAVFVIFMFFVLTLLTKTGAPHPEAAEQCDTRVCLTSCVEDSSRPQDPNKAALSRPLLEESRSLFHCFINEEEQAAGGRVATGLGRGHGVGQLDSATSSTAGESMGPVLRGKAEESRADMEAAFLTHFNIPNFVNSEPNSTLGEDELLLGEPPIIMDCQSHSNSTNRIIID